MSLDGLIFMLLAWGIVLALVIFSFSKVLKIRRFED